MKRSSAQGERASGGDADVANRGEPLPRRRQPRCAPPEPRTALQQLRAPQPPLAASVPPRVGRCVDMQCSAALGAAAPPLAQAARLGARRAAPSRCAARRVAASAAPRQAAGGPAAAAAPDERAVHNARQALAFDARVPLFLMPPPPALEAALARVAAAACLPRVAADDSASSVRVLDVGTGAGALVPHLLRAGATHVLGCDVSAAMLAAAARAHPPPGVGGNARGVRFRRCDAADLPPYEGPFDAAFFCASFDAVYDQREALARAALLLRPGGCVVVAHPRGAAAAAKARQEEPATAPHALPDAAGWRALLQAMPLQLETFTDEPDFYCAVLRLPPRFALPAGPRRLEAPVVRGFGRGSRQMGVPTANLDPKVLGEQLNGLSRGVYYGWARLAGETGPPRKAVLNIGARPTFADGAGDSIEVHVMHDFGRDFYGQRMRVLVLGFTRPELKFASIGDLVARIRADVGQAAALLDAPESASAAQDPFISAKKF